MNVSLLRLRYTTDYEKLQGFIQVSFLILNCLLRNSDEDEMPLDMKSLVRRVDKETVERDGLWAGKYYGPYYPDDKIRRGVEWSAGSSLTLHLTDQSVQDQPTNQAGQAVTAKLPTNIVTNYPPNRHKCLNR